MTAAAANLPPPDGKVNSIATLEKSMRDWMSSSSVPKTYGIAYGTGYDDSQLAEQRRPTMWLQRRGFSKDEIRKIWGENWLRVMKQVWGA